MPSWRAGECKKSKRPDEFIKGKIFKAISIHFTVEYMKTCQNIRYQARRDVSLPVVTLDNAIA